MKGYLMFTKSYRLNRDPPMTTSVDHASQLMHNFTSHGCLTSVFTIHALCYGQFTDQVKPFQTLCVVAFSYVMFVFFDCRQVSNAYRSIVIL